MLLVQSLPMQDSFLKMLILQADRELKSIDYIFDLSFKTDEEIDSSNLNPIAVLLGIQKYSIVQFRNDMIELLNEKLNTLISLQDSVKELRNVAENENK